MDLPFKLNDLVKYSYTGMVFRVTSILSRDNDKLIFYELYGYNKQLTIVNIYDMQLYYIYSGTYQTRSQLGCSEIIDIRDSIEKWYDVDGYVYKFEFSNLGRFKKHYFNGESKILGGYRVLFQPSKTSYNLGSYISINILDLAKQVLPVQDYNLLKNYFKEYELEDRYNCRKISIYDRSTAISYLKLSVLDELEWNEYL